MALDALWNYADPAGSEARFRQRLTELAGQEWASSETLTQLARAQGLQRHFDQAQATLDETARRLETAGDDPAATEARVRYHLERGRVWRSAGAPAAARPWFEEAYRLAQAAGQDGYAVDAAHMIALVGDTPADQIAWNERALALSEASADPRAQAWRGSLYNNLGWAYHDQGAYPMALTLFERALAQRLADGQPEPIRIARWCVARCWRSLGRLEEALAQQQALLAETEEDGYIHEEIAECLLALGQASDARPYFQRAYTRLAADPWLAAQEAPRLQRLQRLGQIG